MSAPSNGQVVSWMQYLSDKSRKSPILVIVNPIPGPIRHVFSDVVSYWSSKFWGLLYKRGPVEVLRDELDKAQTWEEYEDMSYRLDAYFLSVSGVIVGSWEMIYGDRIR